MLKIDVGMYHSIYSHYIILIKKNQDIVKIYAYIFL